MKHLLRRKQGQGMTEYIIIVVLVAIAVLLAVKIFGGTVKTKFTESKDTVNTNLDATGGAGAP
ncbi:MAG: Flp family type IVb pilin [Planctomycetes bacterium]|nr:Flp family type IVb pilin [Planctomycetota bacterium]